MFLFNIFVSCFRAFRLLLLIFFFEKRIALRFLKRCFFIFMFVYFSLRLVYIADEHLSKLVYDVSCNKFNTYWTQ